jgi:membrane-bound lytic murein transglycosylase B
VETRYGSGTGNIKVLDSLGTLALMHPRRSKLFKSQLISYLYLTYSNDLDYNNIYGSYAGAMGAPQFMPESYIKFGVDYDGDGKVDLWNSKHDIFASIANYLKEKGWEKDSPIVSEFKIQKKHLKEIFANGDVKTVKVKKNYLNKILANNIDIETTKNYIALLSKKNKKYKIVHKNFKVIMTYNISTFYAMVVTILSEKIAS